MTTRAAVAFAAAVAVMLALLVAKLMAISVLAGTLLLCALGIAGLFLTARLIGPAKGEHAVPRGYAEADERLALPHERVIPRAITKHAPPWEYQAAPVIEPAAITSGPRSRDLPKDYPEDYPQWTEKLSVACSRGECGDCKWPLCGCPHHADDATSGPPEPQPDAWIVATATLSGGQVTSVQYAAGTAAYVDEQIRMGMGLPPWVAEELGHDSTDDALDSMFNRAMARQVRALTDGAS